MPIKLDGKKVLIIKLRYIGDTLSRLPIIENLRRKPQNTTLDVMPDNLRLFASKSYNK